MPERVGPYIYKRAGRRNYYAFLNRDHFHISLGTEDEQEARLALAKLLERERHLELAAGETTLARLTSKLRERAEAGNTTKTAYELHLNLRRLVKWFEDRGVVTARKVTKDLVEDYKTERRKSDKDKKGVSAARVNRELDSLRRLLKFAIDQKEAHPWALEFVVKMREPRPEPKQRAVTRAHFERFLRAAPAPYRPLFRAAIGSGLRDGELVHLDAVDIRSGEVVVTPKADWSTKGYRHRVIPISVATEKALRAWVAVRDSGAVNIDQKRIWTVMRDACTAAKVPRFSLHDLRRAWASHLLAAGQVPLQDVSALLGHAAVETTERYLQLAGKVRLDRKKLPW